ncbi:putative chemotaxis response regulator [Clostridium carnis]|uniref:Chemotaxis response regulator n=1 Tax=Clostridium carnis TaxID=1530 RepID=A0ABY6SNA6_9CLOT|nr:chemotaxis protein [Clostridium carnis]VDG69322.1 putative chemotaxis response regulator [Clostridium carnis]
MYNILVFGTGNMSKAIEYIINKNVNIVAYIDNDKNKWSSNVFGPNNIKDFNYDFIVIASQYNNVIYNQLIDIGIDKNKILEYYYFFLMSNDELKYTISLYEKNINKYKSIITGLSYYKKGIVEEELLKKGINFAYDSQDLYYDYNIVKYILENYKTNFEYCIIGLSYYSFEYDLSLSSIKDNVYMYYRILKKKHHFDLCDNIEERFQISKNIVDEIFDIIPSVRKNSKYGTKYVRSEKINLSKKELFEIGKNQAKIDSNKNYPDTVKENIFILEKYLNLLIKNKIKPIIVIAPTTKYYYSYFPENMKNNFLEIINNLKSKYDFKYFDYFKSEAFTIEDFQDINHLNSEGSIKFTNILNKYIFID